MDSVLSFAAALVASGFTATLVASHLRRPRPHVAAWSVAMFMYSLATWALWWGLTSGWSDGSFRVFYLFGAILNVPFLALGAAFLVVGGRWGMALLVFFAAFGAGAGAATLGADFVATLPVEQLPAGSEVFAGLSEGIATPRLWALVANVSGTALLVGLAVTTIVRFRLTNRRLVLGNSLIVIGAIAPAIGGSLTGLGEGGGLAATLLVGAGSLWLGFAVASSSRVAAERT
ncbi:MAG: hypothetical protein OEM94_05060 [Acidimicrobiia bacterium]|nr:hypothetical protein [Acidimicrobiia bacterium]